MIWIQDVFCMGIVCKNITLYQLKCLLPTLIDDLCKIIYEYVDPESLVPDP